MCGSCNTSSATTSPNPDALAAYGDVVGKAQSVANTAYQPYGGELVASLNDGQNAAIGQLQGAYGAAQPFVREGNAYINQGAQGLANVQNYLAAGSKAAANVDGWQQQAGGSFANAGSYVGQSAAALGGIKPYMDMAQGSYGLATGYGGLAAGAYGQEQAGLGQVGQYLGKADGYFGQAAGLATPQDFNGADGVSKYMNPYTQSVIDATMAQARQNDAAQTSSLVGNAIGSGAYGGDRNGIAVATLAGQQDMANNSTVAGLNQANYAQATAQFNATQDQRARAAGIYTGLGQGELQAGGTQLQTALGYGNVGAGFTGLGSLANATGSGYAGLAGVQGQTAQQLGNLGQISTGIGSGYNSTGQLGLGTAGMYNSLGTLQGTTGQALGSLGATAANLGALNQSSLISGAAAGLQGSTLQQQNQQQQDTAAYNQYMAGLSYPFQNVGWLSNIVQGIGSQEGQTQTTQGNALSSIAGLGVSSIGILGATGAFGTNGYLSGLGSLATSDIRAKENVAPIGRTYDGQTMYRWNYKGDHPSNVKTGLIAQEVAQRDPGAVGTMAHGLMGVDYDRATAASARMGLGDTGDFAEKQGLDLASRMSRATGGPVPGLGMSPMGSPTMPAGLGTPAMMAPGAMAGLSAGLATRPRFDDGGVVDPSAAIPGGGITFNGVPGGGAGGLNTSAAALTGGGATAHANPGLGQRSPLLTAAPTSARDAQPVQTGGDGSGGFGATASFSGGSSGSGLGTPAASSNSTQDPSSSGWSSGAASGDDSAAHAPSGLGGVSQNGWMAVLSAGLGMMGGTSASGLANVGKGAQQGLQTYLGLQQQDKNNAVQQQELALRKSAQDQTANYQNQSLKLDQSKIDISLKELENHVAEAQRADTYRTATLANDTARTQSEDATRDQTRQIQRYQRFMVPGDGIYVQDLTNPNAPPQKVGSGQDGGGSTPAGGASPPISFNDPPPGGSQPSAGSPTASAPPPQGGVSASGGAPAGGAGFTSPMPGSAPALPTGFSGSAGAVPQASAPAARPVQATAPAPSGSVSVGADWSPTLAPVRGYISPNQVGIYQSPELAKQQSEIGAKAVQEARESSMKASAGQAQLSSMQGAMAALPKTGLLSPGQFGDERATIAKTLNGVAQTLGAAPVFDENMIANTELMKKEAFRLGTAMIADTNGGREAGFILQNSVNATPSLNNSPIGFQRLAAGIQQGNQYKIDRSAFLDAYYGKFGNLDGALQEFNRLNPPQAYVNRAIVSTIPPDYVQRLQQVAKSNPAAVSAFDQRFGPGASSAVLGR